jgi:hypothetical protein
LSLTATLAARKTWQNTYSTLLAVTTESPTDFLLSKYIEKANSTSKKDLARKGLHFKLSRRGVTPQVAVG